MGRQQKAQRLLASLAIALAGVVFGGVGPAFLSQDPDSPANSFERIDRDILEQAVPKAPSSGTWEAHRKRGVNMPTRQVAPMVTGGVRAPVSMELLSNGDFETGSLAPWVATDLAGSAGTFILSTPGTTLPASGSPTSSNSGGGAFYAVADMSNAGTHALSQSFTVPVDATQVLLSFEMFVDDWSGSGGIVNPVGLDHTGAQNQHARVDLMADGSSAFDTGAGVVTNLYLGVDSLALPNVYTPYVFDITATATPGDTFVVRFAETLNVNFLHLGVDNVSVSATVQAVECGDGTIDPPETCEPPGGAGCDCCADKGTPGCTNAVCELLICTQDSFCCEDRWDQLCADTALMEPSCVACCDATCRGDCTACGDSVVQPDNQETCDPPGQPIPIPVNNVAIFQDQTPWGTTVNEDTLTANAIPFTIFDSAGMGVVDLAPFDKLVIASEQLPSFYSALSTHRAWFDGYVAGGGILEFHGASDFTNDWSALPMPAGLAIASQGGGNEDDFLTIVSAGHPLARFPNSIDNDQIDSWNNSAHSYFTAAAEPFTTVIENDGFLEPVHIEFDSGGGCVIASMMALEWTGADPAVLENALLRNCLGGAPVCRTDCTFCGDGVEDPGEECDDGNNADGDGCSALCTLETACGNDVIEPPETCDPPGPLGGPRCDCCVEHPTAGCSNATCEASVCGVDPSCCTAGWDAACAAAALAFPECEACCDPQACAADCMLCGDADGDGLCDADDPCPLAPNPGGGTALFGQTVFVRDKVSFTWLFSTDADWVRGDLAGLSSYSIIALDTSLGVTSIPATEVPAAGGGLYWLFRPDCPDTSWSSGGPGECLSGCPSGARDGNLPPP